MKRKILRLIMILAIATLTVSLSSCRASKKGSSESYQSNSEQMKRSRHKHDNEKHVGKLDSKTRKKIVEEAMTWKGTPYEYARADKGKATDCSGMVMSIYEKIIGVKLPRNSAKQQEFCKELKKGDVESGDLCFFATGKDPDKTSHVGIMIDEKNFIHASTSKGVVVSDITQPYYQRTFKGFGRVPMKEVRD